MSRIVHSTMMDKNNRLKLSTWEKLTHYSSVIFLIFLSLMPLIDMSYQIFTGTYTGRGIMEMFGMAFVFLPFAAVIAFFKYRGLKFSPVNIKYTAEQFDEALQRTALELDWSVDIHTEEVLRATRSFFISGQMITILKEKDKLWMNSISHVDTRGTFSSFLGNRKNINTFLINLAEVIQGIPARDHHKDEWTWARIAIRVGMYSFCIGIIALMINLMFLLKSIEGGAIFLVLIAIAIYYLYIDLKIVFSKK